MRLTFSRTTLGRIATKMSFKNSKQRWQVGRAIFENLMPSLPSPSYVAVMAVAWFYGYASREHRDKKGRPFTEFQISAQQVSDHSGVTRRRVQQILSDLEAHGVIKTVKPGKGTMPSVRIIRHVKYKNPQGE